MIKLGSKFSSACESLAGKTDENSRKWIGVDLDGTVAKYDEWKGWKNIGEPIPEMVKKIKKWMSLGIQVKILTARCSKVSLARNNITFEQMEEVIQEWCEKNIGSKLPVTSEKDCYMMFCVDDQVVQVVSNTGEAIDGNGFDAFDDKIKEVADTNAIAPGHEGHS